LPPLFPTAAQDAVLLAVCVSDAQPAIDAHIVARAATAMTRRDERARLDLKETRFTAALLDLIFRARMTAPEKSSEIAILHECSRLVRFQISKP
jgi:hypothetical protein